MSIDTAARDSELDTLLIDEMADLFKVNPETIRRRLREGTFPIAHLPRRGGKGGTASDPRGIDNKWRWSRALVKKWLEENGGAPAPAAPAARQGAR